MGKSPSKNRREQQTRKPSCCQKCPGRPLRSQCVHTVAGKKWLESHPVIVETQATPTRGHHCRICPDNPSRSECVHTAKGRAFLSVQAAQSRVESISVPELDFQSRTTGPQSPTPRATALDPINPVPSSVSDLNNSSMPHLSPSRTPDENIDPDLLAISQRRPSNGNFDDDFFSQPSASTTPRTLFQPTSRSSPATDISDSPPIKETGTTPNSSQSSFLKFAATRRKPTQANPFHGHVDGVKRGNAPYVIHRNKALPNVVENSRDASRRFSRLLNKIVEKCEDVSSETGCWLFLGAQHTTARGGTISYASPRLRSEAQSTASALATEFNGAITSLLSARRTDAAELQRKYEEAQASKKAAELQLSEQQKLIDTYRRQYGALNNADVGGSGPGCPMTD